MVADCEKNSWFGVKGIIMKGFAPEIGQKIATQALSLVSQADNLPENLRGWCCKKRSSAVSYVVGNGWQLNCLTAEEKVFLDAAPRVIVINSFLSHWREAGFCPTVWVQSDTRRQEPVAVLDQQLGVILQDDKLLERLRCVLVNTHMTISIVRDILAKYANFPVPIIHFKRDLASKAYSKVATDISQFVYRYGSTLTCAVNLAELLSPGGEIRLLGCPYTHEDGHFYNSSSSLEQEAFDRMMDCTWAGFGIMRAQGINLVDCNTFHRRELSEGMILPRKNILD